ncbi:MAG TPA: hypothetical protein VE422_19230 [Terriglobia bacterium]|nr:hypothetical protein [Terriglobia bacterium]
MSQSEAAILAACVDRKLSKDEAFEELYRMYAPTVLGWLVLRVGRPSVDDLMQDVWTDSSSDGNAGSTCRKWRRRTPNLF